MKKRHGRLFGEIIRRDAGEAPLLRRFLKHGVITPAKATPPAPAPTVARAAAPPPAPPPPTARPLAELKAFVDAEYLGSPPATIEKFRQAFQELAAVGVKTTADLTPETLARWAEQWREKRSYGASHSVLRTMRRICSLAKEAEPTPFLTEVTDPFRRRKLAKILRGHQKKRPTDRHLSIDQMKTLIAQADAEASGGDWKNRRLRSLVYLLAYSGIRKLEALAMTVADVDLNDQILWVWPNGDRSLKTESSAAPLGIHPELARVLKEWMDETGSDYLFPTVRRDKPWRSGGPGQRPLDQLKELGERAGIPGVTFLGFRQTIASLAEAWGWENTAIQRQMRHKSPNTQHNYRRADKRTVRKIANSIDYSLDDDEAPPEPPAFRPRIAEF